MIPYRRLAERRSALASGVALALVATVAACTGPGQGSRPDATARPTTPAATSAARAQGATVLGVLGDFGVDRASTRAVVNLIAAWRPAAVVTTGDNAYESGTGSQAALSRRLLQPALAHGARLVASLGNHDESGGSGQPVMAVFGMPGRWYSTVVGSVQLIVLDANIPRDPTQLAWLRSTLAAPRPATWRVAVFHQPAASCSVHPASRGVDEAWLPLFSGTVDLVVSGHNHTYERFTGARGLVLVTTGGGGNTLYPSARSLCRGPATPVFFATFFHAVRIEAGAQALLLQAVEPGGAVRDQITLRR